MALIKVIILFEIIPMGFYGKCAQSALFGGCAGYRRSPGLIRVLISYGVGKRSGDFHEFSSPARLKGFILYIRQIYLGVTNSYMRLAPSLWLPGLSVFL